MKPKKIINQNIFSVFALAIFSIFVLSGCQIKSLTNLATNKNVSIEVLDQPQPGEVAVINNNIIINKPLSNDVISSPLEITGRASVLAGKVLFRLKDMWDQIIATSSAQTLVQAPGWGYYNGKLEFKIPPSPNGWLEVYSQSPKDGSEQNLIKLPIVFKDAKKPKVLIYFNNLKQDPELTDCSQVHPVEREVDFTNQLPLAAINELLKGPTEQETKDGFITNIPKEGVGVKKLEIKESAAYIDFNQALQAGVAGSCRVLAIRSQIEKTLKEFLEIQKVEISIDGKTEDILQP